MSELPKKTIIGAPLGTLPSPSVSGTRGHGLPRRNTTTMPSLRRNNSVLTRNTSEPVKLSRRDSSESVARKRRISTMTMMTTASSAAAFLNTVSKPAREPKIQERTETSQEKRQRIRKKLRVLFWTAKMVGGVALHMRNDSMRLTETSGMAELYGMISYSEDEEKRDPPGGGKGLKFDKTLFSRAKGSALPLPARIIASKLPQFRSEQDLQVLYRVLNSMRSFKEKLTQQMKHNVCKSAGYLSCDSGRIIFRQGHDGTDFYFIYSGSVMVQVSRKDVKTGETFTSIESVIESGDSFGELGLLSADGIRTATVICREQTELFQIDKESFLENFSELFKIELNTKLQLARDLPLFHDWTEERLRALCFKSVLMSQPLGKVIEKDWSTTKRIVFLIKGKILLLRAITVAKAEKLSDSYIVDSYGRALPCKTARGSRTPRKPRSRPCTTSKSQNTTSPSQDSSATCKRFIAVGVLLPGQSSDLRILSKRLCEYVEPVIMVSQGCEFLRFLQHDIEENISTANSRARYLAEEYIPMDLPSVETLERHYYEHIVWRHYKHQVLDLSYNESRGLPVAMRPATAKGSTGWGRWPGMLLQDLKSRACPLHPDGWSCSCPPVDSKHKSVVFE